MAYVPLCLLLFLLSPPDVVQGTLYAIHIDENTQKVAVRQILYDNGAKGELSEWSLYIGQNQQEFRYVGYSTMDVKRDIFITQYRQSDHFLNINIRNGTVSSIPAPYLFDPFRYRCLCVDSEDGTLLAINGNTNKLNSIDWITGNLTHIMDTSNITTIRLGDGCTHDDKRKTILGLSLDWTPQRGPGENLKDVGYTNVLNIINYKEKTAWNQTISCQYKIEEVHYHPSSDTLYGMEYEAGWLLQDPTNTTIYIGRINQETWSFERLVELAVPFYSDNYLTTFCASRGHYILAWPQPGYDPYIMSNNGVLQVIDVINAKILYNDQVQGWYMTTRHSENDLMSLIPAMECSDT